MLLARLLIALIPLCCCSGVSLHTGYKFVILGGTGRIGTAVASHLLLKSPDAQIILVGRDERKGVKAVEEVLSERSGSVRWEFVENGWDVKNKKLLALLEEADCLVHTAGPYLGEQPTPLKLAIQAKCSTYIDVSDPLDFLEASLQFAEEAETSGTTALLAAGAFPGMSNVLGVESAAKLPAGFKTKDIRFNYFTAGLGGSGDVNLYITNLGFGEPMAQFEHGKLRLYESLSGLLLGKVDFFLEDGAEVEGLLGSREVRRRVGTKTVFSWPFPEAATVAQELRVVGESSAAMGTAPDIWNDMLGILVTVVPRSWWRSPRFSRFLADFSQPLVKATDTLLRWTSPDNVGETHAMRIDVVGEDCNNKNNQVVSFVQGHESFRRCVGQSCAEFALDLLQNPSPGVQLPEQRYRETEPRQRILSKLRNIPGTFAWTNAVVLDKAPRGPTDLKRALQIANEQE